MFGDVIIKEGVWCYWHLVDKDQGFVTNPRMHRICKIFLGNVSNSGGRY